jgi:hypothetical protein
MNVGVAHLPELSRLEFAADTVFPRQEGIGIMDSDLRVRIFLQQAATAKRGGESTCVFQKILKRPFAELPIGARFFSMKVWKRLIIFFWVKQSFIRDAFLR